MSASTSDRRRRKPRSLLRRAVRRVLVVLLLAYLATSAVLSATVMSTRWIDPPTTAFMVRDGEPALYEWVDGAYVAEDFLLAVLVREDIHFPTRGGGVEWGVMRERVGNAVRRLEDEGGSTIQQQLAKNLVLWKRKEPVRKLLFEPVLAEVIARGIPRRRQLELYVNVAEFGRGIWGVCAASWYYYRNPPSVLTVDQAAALVGMLSMPKYYRAAKVDGVVPLDPPPGSRHTPVGLLAFARTHIPARMAAADADALLRDLRFRADPHGNRRCETMPPAVRDRLVAEGASAAPRPPG